MKKHIGVAMFSLGLGLGLFIFVLWLPPAQADPAGGVVPHIPAFLPIMTVVPMTDKLPIDGEWMVNTIRKRIRIEGGRAYAVDPWLHLFVLKVEPLMVVLKELRRTGPGQYTGQDLPLMGKLTATLMSDGSLGVSVAGALGPAKYSLIPIRIDDQQSFDLEKSGQYVPPVAAQPYPSQPAPVKPYPEQPAPAPPPQPVVSPVPAPAPEPVTPPSPPADCKPIGVDPDTHMTICAE